jgi:RNA ligase (TIGR02306 family)
MTENTVLDPASTPDGLARQLATVETITAIRDIPDAEFIVCARVRGWDVVVKRGEFTVGDQCVYFEVDSLLDITDPRFEFLSERGVRTDSNGNTGHVLKTARLRGQYSQGLALPMSEFPEIVNPTVGDDLTQTLNVVKWDPPIPAELAGQVRGMRPSTIPATGEVRVQNMEGLFALTDLDWIATEKIDGESTTFYADDTTDTEALTGVCTRNLDLLPSEDNRMWNVARSLDIHARMIAQWPGAHVAVQGETFGAGLPKNPLKINDTRFCAFTLRVNGAEVPRAQWPQWLLDIAVPVHPLTFPSSLDEALAQVETLKSLIAPQRAAEGVVWRAVDRSTVVLPDGQVARASFKVISNKYLLKNDR